MTATAVDVRRVVIAEDDYLVSEEIARELAAGGDAVVAEVSDGRAAIEATCRLQPDVVLMDIKMPELDGLEATRRIQTQCPTPVVVLTTYDNAGFVEAAGQAGASAYLTKPPRPRELDRAITLAIARHGDLMRIRALYEQLQVANRDLSDALHEVRTLRGIVPICGYCKSIRNDAGYWEQLEVYLRHHSEAEMSTGICPECMKKYHGDLTDDKPAGE